jgi:hypothetical protein
MALYGQCYLYVDGSLLSETAAVDVSLAPVVTDDIFDVHDGYKGIAHSPVMGNIDATFALPQKGPEFDAWSSLIDNTKHRVQVFMADGITNYQFEGRILGAALSGAVGQNSSAKFTFRGIAVP